MQLKCKKEKRFVQCMEKVTDRMCQKWFAKFYAGDFSLDDAPQLGRQVDDNSDQIETLIENNQYYTTQEIADIPKIPKSRKLLVKMKNVSFILWKKPNGFLVNPILTNAFHQTVPSFLYTVFSYLFDWK